MIDCYRHGNFKKKYFEEGQAINKIQFIGTIFIILTLLFLIMLEISYRVNVEFFEEDKDEEDEDDEDDEDDLDFDD